MMKTHRTFPFVPLTILLAAFFMAQAAAAQITTPAPGGNQKSTIIQHIGPVAVTVHYSSPDVTAPNGDDRRGKIWGGLVHWGFRDENFGTCTECPWRAGANENTVITFSHDVEIEGKPLAAGTYGLHMAAGEKEWTIIFSHDSRAWGSYFYDATQDALRVRVPSEKAEYRHWLTYDFFDRQAESTSLRLWWEDLAVPFTISVPNINQVYLKAMRDDLRDRVGFTWTSWVQAASFCLQNEINLEEAEEWAKTAVTTPFLRGRNYASLSVLAQLQKANGKAAEAMKTAKEALEMAANDREREATQTLIDGMS